LQNKQKIYLYVIVILYSKPVFINGVNKPLCKYQCNSDKVANIQFNRQRYYDEKQQRNKNKISNVNFVDTLWLAQKLKEIQAHMYTTVNTMTYTYVDIQ